MSRKGHLYLVAKLSFSFGLLWFLYRHISLREITAQLAGTDIQFLPLIFTILISNTYISTLKWHLLLKADTITVPIKSLFVSYMVGTFWNIFLPSNIGGDAYRMYDVSISSNNPAGSFASVFADRISGFLSLVIIAAVSSVVIFERTPFVMILIIPFVMLGMLLIVLWGLYCQTPVKWVLRITRLDRLATVVRFTEKFLDSFVRYRKQSGLVVIVMLISFGFQFLTTFCVFVMALSINIHVPFVYFCAFVPLITLMEAIPISIYGVGVRDAGYVFFFGMAGLSPLQTRSLALLYLAITVCYALFGGILWAFRTFYFSGKVISK